MQVPVQKVIAFVFLCQLLCHVICVFLSGFIWGGGVEQLWGCKIVFCAKRKE